jgi:hypothetical protein
MIIIIILLYIKEYVLSQSVYHTTSKSCMIQSNSIVYTDSLLDCATKQAVMTVVLVPVYINDP